MRTLRLVGVLFLVTAMAAHASLDPATILSPRPGGWVVDQFGLLSPDQKAEINALADAVHARGGAEMAVVVVSGIGGTDHRDFATRLFNRWEIGRRTQDNGLLVFVAVGDRAAEIILGDGIDSDAQVALSDRIMQAEMVPQFRRGENAAAVVAGARACAREFFGATSPSRVAPVAEVTDVEASSAAVPSVPRAASVPSARARRDTGIPGPVVFGGLGGIGVVGWLAIRAWLRMRSRRCGRCAMTMSRLAETQDDAHLSASERVEEKLGSVDYDVWLCPGCGAVDKVRRGAWFTRYSRCPQCGSVTTSKAERTLSSATTFSSGLVEVHERCQNCNHAQVFTRTTPRLASSSGSGRSSSGFGGGRSSGRGSSGKW